ncbi:DUF2254 family protein [Chromobacterium amazonense]|uniref:DUF2254 family protein n=1 Tax=Chromobacterium amazonense TaxID=1382803 RepID=UPI003F7A3DCE
MCILPVAQRPSGGPGDAIRHRHLHHDRGVHPIAILLMSLTLASMQFSPRIIVSFSRDKVTQRTLGIFPGALAYCIAAETEQAMSRMRGRLDALQTLAA